MITGKDKLELALAHVAHVTTLGTGSPAWRTLALASQELVARHGEEVDFGRFLRDLQTAIRVAQEKWKDADQSGLGGDAHGRAMAELCAIRLEEVRALLCTTQRRPSTAQVHHKLIEKRTSGRTIAEDGALWCLAVALATWAYWALR